MQRPAADALADRAIQSRSTHDVGTINVVPDGGAENALRVSLLYEMGRWDDASRMLARMPAAGGDFRQRAMAALLAARRGDAAPARRMDAELAALNDRWLFGEPAAWRARIAAVLRDDERAIQLLEEAFAAGQGARLRWHLHTFRDFDGLRAISEFRSMYESR